MASQFAEVANKLLGEAQKSFLERAQQRFTQAGESNEAKLKALLQPVEHTLKRYEENVAKVETERQEAYGHLPGLIDAMRLGQATERGGAAQPVNAMSAAPKAPGRPGATPTRTPPPP